MLQIEQINELYDYSRWANARLWQAVEGLEADQLDVDISNGIGSILMTLLHLAGATHTWRTRWEGTARVAPPPDRTLEAIHAAWQEEEAHLQRFLATLSDNDLTREVRYSRAADPTQVFVQPLWKTMLHLVNHQTQHRSEIAMRLTALNHSPGELGMSTFFNQQSGSH